MNRLIASTFTALALSLQAVAANEHVLSFTPKDGAGGGKHIVLLSGDEEYRSEEALPMLGKLLAEKHGFKTTVLFSIGEDGTINPNKGDSVEGIEALDSADLVIMLLRFRHWPDDKMAKFDAYLKSGKPIIALRTSTHAFNIKDGKYADYSWTAKGNWPGGFGRHILGETWVSHWGKHKKEGCLGVVEEANAASPILRGVEAVFADSDVYEAAPPADAKILMRGKVLAGMTADTPPAIYSKKNKGGQEQDVNAPMMPIVWTREVDNGSGTKNKILCTTMGAATDLKNEGLRRLVTNGAYHLLGLEVPAKADVAVEGYNPTMYGFDGFKKGVKVADLKH
ncbi:MAG: ThuA domain-containing protein [Verrucomicrobiaceae bacterium]|nr:ThuA domain-containing protein [Verrucomicrobiaceae bacterium]